MQTSSLRQKLQFFSAFVVCTLLLLIGDRLLQQSVGDSVYAAPLTIAPDPSGPDLIIHSVTLSPTNPISGTIGDIQIVIKNQGTITATGFSTLLYVDPSAGIPTADTSTTTETYYEIPLPPGESYIWTRTGHPFTGANPQIYVWVDPPWEDRVAEANEQNNLYPHVATQLVDITPAQATAGTQLTVTVTATNSHFVDGLTTAHFGAGVTVSHVQVMAATQALVGLAIADDAAAGPRLVQLATGDEIAVGANLFTVHVPTPPRLTAITPNHAPPGAALIVSMSATNTHFSVGTGPSPGTVADFGPGIGIQALTVLSATALQAQLQIGNAATPGLRTVTVTTPYSGSTEVVVLEDGFRVDAPATRDATLAIIPSPTTLLVDRVRTFNIVVTPGTTPVNGVQIHGRVDPTYLTVQQIISGTHSLTEVMGEPMFDPSTGEFQYAVGALNGRLTAPFVVLSLMVKAKQATPEAGTAITFLNSAPATDIAGPSGSILQGASDATVHITADAESATLQGQVDLQGRPAKPHAAWRIGLTVELTDRENSEQPLIRQRVTTDVRGEFTLAGLPIGRYYLRIKGDHTLGSAIETVALVPGENRLYLGTLLEGDIEHDRSRNSITAIDFGLLSGALGLCDGDAGYVAFADLDEIDDCVTMLDAGLLVTNYNASGDRVFATPDRVPAPIAFSGQATARLAFAAAGSISSTHTITGDLYTNLELPLYVDPGSADEPILAVTGHYTYNPALLEVTALDLSMNPNTLLLQSQVDNRNGSVHFQLIMPPDHAIDEVREVALIKIRIKARTSGTDLVPVRSGPQAVTLVGPQGNALADADTVTLISKAGAPISLGNRQYLPIVMR